MAKGRQLFNEVAVLRDECKESQTSLDRLSLDIEDRCKRSVIILTVAFGSRWDQRQQDLSSVEIKREMNARDYDSSISFALDWLERHGLEFDATVHKPPMISVNVSNPAYAWQIEMCTSASQRKVKLVLVRGPSHVLIPL